MRETDSASLVSLQKIEPTSYVENLNWKLKTSDESLLFPRTIYGLDWVEEDFLCPFFLLLSINRRLPIAPYYSTSPHCSRPFARINVKNSGYKRDEGSGALWQAEKKYVFF